MMTDDRARVEGELKPCPFCGCAVEVSKGVGYHRDEIVHLPGAPDCQMEFGRFYTGDSGSIAELWNARAPEPSVPGTIAEACDKIEQYIADYYAAKYPSDAWVPNLTNMIACQLSDIRGVLQVVTPEPSARGDAALSARLLRSLELLANTAMNLSMADWSEHASAVQEAAARLSAPPSAAAAVLAERELVEAAAFLLDRISELDWSLDRDDFAREWHGHVEPPLVRLDRLIEPFRARSISEEG